MQTMTIHKIGKKFYEQTLKIFARPIFQKLHLKLLRIILGYLGYINFSEDFRLTGERNLFRILKSHHIRLSIDIGANKGQWANLYLRNTSGKIISFEPQSAPFKLLLEMQRQNPDRMNAINCAIGNRSGKIKINIHQYSDELSFINFKIKQMPLLQNKVTKMQMVPIYTLDELFEKEPDMFQGLDFIKIDTEGYEFEVLSGAIKLITDLKPKFIQIEMNWHQLFTGHTLWEMSKLLPDHKVFQLLPYGRSLYEIDPRDPVRNFMQLSNFLFVRN